MCSVLSRVARVTFIPTDLLTYLVELHERARVRNLLEKERRTGRRLVVLVRSPSGHERAFDRGSHS